MEKSECNYNLNEWKTFVLKELCNLNEASLIDTIWNRLKVNQKVPESDRKAHYLYTGLVLKCLEDEKCSRWDRYLGMTAAMTQVPVPTAI